MGTGNQDGFSVRFRDMGCGFRTGARGQRADAGRESNSEDYAHNQHP
jgi:hypothetical protein